MESIIETRALTRRFGSLTAVDRLDLTVARGEIFGLVGPDGAGKTTTLRLLAGLMDITSGEARVAGYNVATDPAAVRDRIGYMAQRFGLYPDLTVEENMAFYADLFGWTITDAGREYALVVPSEPGIGGGILQVTDGMPTYLTLYVQVERLEEALARALALGATAVVGPRAIPGVGRFAMFQDPEGHLVGLLEPAAER